MRACLCELAHDEEAALESRAVFDAVLDVVLPPRAKPRVALVRCEPEGGGRDPSPPWFNPSHSMPRATR